MEESSFWKDVALILLIMIGLLKIENINENSDYQSAKIDQLRNSLGEMRAMYLDCEPDKDAENLLGFYNERSQKITVLGGVNPPKELMKTALHEIGHYVWYELFTDIERDKYDIIMLNNTYLTAYSNQTQDPSEDFAEAYSIYFTNETKLPSDRQEYFEKYVSGYTNH